jgi:hypothetical protein
MPAARAQQSLVACTRLLQGLLPSWPQALHCTCLASKLCVCYSWPNQHAMHALCQSPFPSPRPVEAGTKTDPTYKLAQLDMHVTAAARLAVCRAWTRRWCARCTLGRCCLCQRGGSTRCSASAPPRAPPTWRSTTGATRPTTWTPAPRALRSRTSEHGAGPAQQAAARRCPVLLIRVHFAAALLGCCIVSV